MMAERSRSRLTSGSHAAISPLPQPGDQVFLRPVALDPIEVSAQRLQVLDVVLATAAAWDVVAHGPSFAQYNRVAVLGMSTLGQSHFIVYSTHTGAECAGRHSRLPHELLHAVIVGVRDANENRRH